jgi:hypothetical protein
MNEMADKQEEVKKGWVWRLLTAVTDKLFAEFCTYQIGTSPYDTQMFMNTSGFDNEQVMVSQSLTRLKWDKEVTL